MHRKLRSALLPVLLLLCFTGAARTRAKPKTQVIRIQDLGFGRVFPGVQATVQPIDAGAGRYMIMGRRNQRLQLTFIFPPTLTSGGGATVPITFGPASAGYSASGSIGSVVPFDPSVPFTVRLGQTGIGWVYLGGTLLPNSAQAAGSYTASILLSAN